MGYWEIIIPQARVNLVSNPSVQGGTTGYTAVGGSIAQNGTYQKWRLHSLAVTPTSGTTDAVYYGAISLTNAQLYVASVYIRGVVSIPYKIYFANTSGTLKATATTFTGTGDWQRVQVSWTADSSSSFRIYVTKNSDASTGDFYIDGLQCEIDEMTTFIDGDQPGCSWDVIADYSTSRRDAQSRAGGRIVNLTTLGLYVTGFSDTGMPPHEHIIQEYAMLPGAEFQGRRIKQRAFTITGDFNPSTWEGLQSARKDIIDAIQPDLVRDDQAFILRYTGANSTKLPVEISAYYDTGLEFRKPDGFSETIGVRMIAYDPFFYEEGESAAGSHDKIVNYNGLLGVEKYGRMADDFRL